MLQLSDKSLNQEEDTFDEPEADSFYIEEAYPRTR